MKNMRPLPSTTRSRGFVLVTSLIFLVVITLLAVSAINSATLQERMASNQREKSRALQAADAGLRQGELLMRDPVFNDAQPPGSTVNVANPGQPAATVSLRLWRPGAFLGNDTDGNPADSLAFLDPAIWQTSDPLSYDVDAGNARLEPVRYYIEDYECVGRDLNPGNRAKCDGSIIYRVTARATGENPAAVAVTQSLYEKRY